MPNDGGRLKNIGAMTLDRWDREPLNQHRALLLLAMQDPQSNPSSNGVCDGRNVAKVIACMRGSVKRSTVRKWYARRAWEERITAHGLDAQAYAIELYRAFYYEKWAERDLEILAPVVSLPMSTIATPHAATQTAVQDEALRVVKRILPPDPPPEVQERVEGIIEKRRKQALGVNQNVQQIVRAGVFAIRDAIRAAVDPEFRKDNPHIEPIRARMSDLPRLYEVLKQLNEEAHRLQNPEVAATNSAPQLVDSVRVRIAKDTGSNFLDAVREDCLEVVAMIDAMTAPELTIHDLAREAEERQQAENEA